MGSKGKADQKVWHQEVHEFDLSLG